MIKDLHIYVQKVLPLVYDDSLSYYELLNKVVNKINEVIGVTNDISGTIKTEVSSILTTWLSDGTLEDIIGTTLDNLGDDIDDLDTRLTAAEGTISGHTNSIGALEDDVDALQVDVKYMDPRRLKGQTIVFFGDSWTVGGSASQTSYRFSSQLAAMFGMTEKNYGMGGAGFTRSGNLISSQVTTAINDMTAAERNAVPLVILTGGVNDLRNMSDTDMTEFMENAATTCQSIHNAYPNAVLVAAIANTTLSGMTAEKLRWITGAQERIQYHRTYPMIVCTDCFNWVRNRSEWYQSDGLHLTDLGHGVWANRIAQAICGASTEIFDFVGSVTLDSEVASLRDADSRYMFKHGSYISTQDMRISFVTPITAKTLIGTIPAACVPLDNAYGLFTYGDSTVGTFAISGAGNVYVTPLPSVTSISQGFAPALSFLCT